LPSGYRSPGGTSIYLTIAAIFVAQATNTHLSLSQEGVLLLVLMLTSKGSAAVTVAIHYSGCDPFVTGNGARLAGDRVVAGRGPV